MHTPKIGLGHGFLGAKSKTTAPNPIVSEKKDWMGKASKSIKHPGICTGDKLGSKSCPEGSRQYALAKTFAKGSKKSHAKHDK